jgi:L-2-hydroxyglutarate oxidase LhgO
LSKYNLSVLLLESADDVTQGATKGNSGIVHAGYDDKPGSVRAKFCWAGNQMFPQLDKELRFGYQKNGSLVLATNEEEMKHLEELLERGKKNGVERLRIISGEEVRQMEPYVNQNVVGALHSPDAGNLIPYEFTIAVAENAVDNGVELRIRREVTNIKVNEEDGIFHISARHWEPESYVASVTQQAGATGKKEDDQNNSNNNNMLWVVGFALGISSMLVKGFQVGVVQAILVAAAVLGLGLVVLPKGGHKKKTTKSAAASPQPPVGTGGKVASPEEMKIGGSGSSGVVQGQTIDVELIKAKTVINCAGSFSDKIANMIGDFSFNIKPRLGDYLLFHRNQGKLANATLFPCPGPLGKGVLVQQTLWGNLILGPTARDVHDPEKFDKTPEEIREFIISKCKNLVDSFDTKEIIHAFSGSRAKCDRGDWVIEHSPKNKKLINVAGIDSPGLAGSPAIAEEVVRMIGELMPLSKKASFNPNRSAIIVPKSGFKGLKMSKYPERRKNEGNPRENVVCKCEKVTEYEIVEALHRSLPIDSTQAIRKRTRAGMGHCQAEESNYNCECRVAEIIARETQAPVEAVGRRPWPATSFLPQRWMTDEQKESL